MPILDLQRRLAEAGRIRIGEQVDIGNGKKRPGKLDKFRFTSAMQSRIDEAATVFGGEPKPWKSPTGQQFELYTERDWLDVLIPPGDMAFSQWREVWSAGGCQKRCDGDFDIVRDCPCDCDPEKRECKDTTRLSVILPDLEGAGLWRVESHGYYAAVELGGAVDILQSLAPGRLVPGRLWLDKRQVKREGQDGKPQTRNFVVPVLDIKGRLAELQPGPHAAVALAAPAAEGNGGLTPVPASLPAAPVPSVADQMAAVTVDKPRSTRSNAQEPLPATGLEPGPAPDPTPDPDAKASKAERDTIRSLGEQMDDDQRKQVTAWRKTHGVPGMSSPDLTSADATRLMNAIETVLSGDTPDGDGGGGSSVPPSSDGGGAVEEAAPPAALFSAAPDGEAVAYKEVYPDEWKKLNRHLQGIANGSKARDIAPALSPDEQVRENQRHSLVYGCSSGRVTSWADATRDELGRVEAWLKSCAAGRVEWVDDPEWPGGTRPQLKDRAA